MRRASAKSWRPLGVAVGFMLAAIVQACDTTPPPTRPTPLAQSPESSPNLTGSWQGGISLSANEYDTAYFSLTLVQAGTSLTGTFECLYRCVHANGTVRGTISGIGLNWSATFPDGGSCDSFGGTISERGLSGDFSCAVPIATDGTARGKWSAARLAASSCVPELVSPTTDSSLDNGRIDGRDSETWDFDWTDCPGASGYQILVIGPHAIYPVVDDSFISESSFRNITCGSYVADQNRFGWRWRVRASTNGQWGNWSAEGRFNVERVDTDSPAACDRAAP